MTIRKTKLRRTLEKVYQDAKDLDQNRQDPYTQGVLAGLRAVNLVLDIRANLPTPPLEYRMEPAITPRDYTVPDPLVKLAKIEELSAKARLPEDTPQ